MNDDPIALLERELVEAARRQADNRRTKRPYGLGRIVEGFAIAAVLAVTLVIGAGALILLGRQHRANSPTRAVSDRQQLVDIIGALRRPQTFADLHSPTIARLLSGYQTRREPWDARGAPELPLIRRAAVTPWGEAVFLVPLKPTSGRRQEGLLWTTRSFTDCCSTAADVKTFGEVNNEGQVKRRIGGREEALDRFVAVVPDGVAKVQLGRLMMTVHDNVAAAQANGNLVGPTPVMFWFGPDGNAIRRIGDMAGSYRSLAIPQPGPVTAASRAAERDPSTPNPVWTTPRLGGPHTTFRVHFRALLNAAGYTYTVTGGKCRSLWGTQAKPDDSRGHIWSDTVLPVSGKSWCRGTYHLSVTVTDLGPPGTLKHPSRPFGTARFVVR
jgi:hypothetical protein